MFLDGWSSPGRRFIISFDLNWVKKGYPLIHGSAVGKDGRAYVFSARGGTGKTITTLNFVKRGFDFYSDDSVILGDHEIFSFVVPFNLRFTYDIESLLGIQFSPKTKRELFLKRCIYFLTAGKISLFTTLEAKQIFPYAIRSRGSLEKVYILFQGPEFSLEKNIPLEWATTDTLVNMQFECPELISLLLAYSYCFPKSVLSNFWEKIGGNIIDALKGVETHRISIPVSYTEEIFDRIYNEASA